MINHVSDVISSKSFTIHLEKKMMMSSITKITGFMYIDECESLGLKIESSKTHKIVYWILKNENKYYYELFPVSVLHYECPEKLQDWKILIYKN